MKPDFWEDVTGMAVGAEVRVQGDGQEQPVHGILTAKNDVAQELTVANFAGKAVVLHFANRPKEEEPHGAGIETEK